MTDNMPTEIRHGDCIDKMQELNANSVHAVVTDPPYGLAFMGRDWDDFEPKEYQEWCEEWAAEALRVLKPGGHLIAFSGSRTEHRLKTGVEDAGFAIRDTITYLYGTGLPKGSDIGKHIDRWGPKNTEAEIRNVCEWLRAVVKASDKSFHDVADHMDVSYSLAHAHWCAAPRHVDAELPSREQLDSVLEFVGSSIDAAPEDVREQYDHIPEKAGEYADSWDRRDVVETLEDYDAATGEVYGDYDEGDYDVTAPATSEAEEWDGWRTQLKPAAEFAVLARAPMSESAAYRNVLKHGTGALNISATEIEDEEMRRYPPNVTMAEGVPDVPESYFYTSKASKRERTVNGQVENNHSTVKPLDLMEWLVTLVTAPGQTVLDPFAGSGTTIMACRRLNRGGIGIEQDADHADLARQRVELAHELETDQNNSPTGAMGEPGEDNGPSEEGQQGLDVFADGGESEQSE